MKGIILAGGTGSRLYPLTQVTNKHLLPVGRKPMILHCISRLTEAGIRDIMVITGTEHMGHIVGLLGSGDAYGCELTYRVQEKPDGIAGAIRLCKSFVGNSDFAVILGDNIFENSLRGHVDSFKNRSNDVECSLLFKEVHDPQRFGVGRFENGKLVELVEKPKDPPSNLACVGFYLYSSNAFQKIGELNPSLRGELEVTDLNQWYVSRGVASFTEQEGWWTDAGTFESYSLANTLCGELE
jgi:glucose-1-phosphate thymidylyltransferase